ncbi:hypothetical protein TNIN_263821 [Trichonephila inaurata madagascariensis]|uniref:Uncharacterized protein n=2 Tax=Trichonephila inaurata madagascariensis TaxID=2747483 RepID=A0A8X6XAJ3_9ARAC|nr:hypothetical protein TNIN_263821 [Trichonephila inaurata madagascariensis]
MVLESAEIPIPRGLFSSEVNEATTSRGTDEIVHTLSNIFRPFSQGDDYNRDRNHNQIEIEGIQEIDRAEEGILEIDI